MIKKPITIHLSTGLEARPVAQLVQVASQFNSEIYVAAFSIIAGVFVGGLGALAAGLGAASGLTFAYWAALFLTLIGGICQLIAGIKGVKHSKRSEKAGGLIVWGAIVAVFSVLSIVMNLVNGGEFNVTSVLTGVAVPALYIYGAVLNSKADAQYAA